MDEQSVLQYAAIVLRAAMDKSLYGTQIQRDTGRCKIPNNHPQSLRNVSNCEQSRRLLEASHGYVEPQEAGLVAGVTRSFSRPRERRSRMTALIRA